MRQLKELFLRGSATMCDGIPDLEPAAQNIQIAATTAVV